ncbi:hypothetical protein [Tautonia plasticadhaerens]|uniref:CHAP domain protein n=1 Tax=Tautonia plasticadhaerens TaxID=2527974 RepID=A0A518H2N8_9BACT|nr:hypothetical protein [Tautonia plasticadhaerens]QDV35077.1 hypothetical protein ElP_29790 [Tautonia plasticadhaerens]
MSNKAAKIVEVAKRHVGSALWAYSVEKGDFGKNTNKCNLFVYDVMVEADARPLPVVSRRIFWTRPPLAREWADPAVEIEGWDVVSSPEPGDVISEAHEYADATGHVGIVVGPGETVSAASNAVLRNDWGFRQGQKPTYRRLSRPLAGHMTGPPGRREYHPPGGGGRIPEW